MIHNRSAKKEARKQVFEDTMRLSKSNERLSEAIEQSRKNQFVIHEGPMPEAGNGENHRFDRKAEIIVSTKRSYEAARAYCEQGKKTCVLNFANAFHPGGGVKNGSSAQEECLCRCSTLYPCISDRSATQYYHELHKTLRNKGNYTNMANDDCIYTPGIIVMKSDDELPQLLPEEEWYELDVITCAAPDLREYNINPFGMPDDSEMQRIHEQRGRRILDLAKRQKNDVLILGAFGCGAFVNRPETVACAYKKILKDYLYDFDTIEFAVAGKNRNYEVFEHTLSAAAITC